ncbi:MAG: DNA-binding response regulator [Acidobacteria bacterium]|nr:MAG: DNA-binding response regulator [Acidobacteriota bacterium]
MIRILLVEDHAIVREGIAKILATNKDLEVIGEAANGKDAVSLFAQLRPDLAIIDVSMPGMSGIETASQIRTRFQDACIIMLSSHDHEEDIYQAIQAGARGYILKDASAAELFAAIDVVRKGERYIPPAVARQLAQRIAMDELTERESEILKLISAGKSNKEIADTLGVSEGTIKSHVNHILSKLGATDRTQAVSIAIKKGLVHL